VAEALPVVAVVGRPNVGKSSFVNRVLGRREAIVQEAPGVTRDRRAFVAEWAGRNFEIFDTGGLEPGARGLEARAAEQAQVAIEAADVVVLVVDATAGVTQDDLEVAELLRRSGKPVLVVANKVDDPRDEPEAAAFHRLGLGVPVAMSALHGRGSGDALQALVELLPDVAAEPLADWAALAIVGRPNVGKSSLLNCLLGEDRSLVHEHPGTTRDPVDDLVELPGGRRLRLVDTAGMRRGTRIDDELEYFSYLRARRTLERVDAVVLVVDAGEGMTANDQRIAEQVVASGRACVVALNKWDLVPPSGPDRERFERDLRMRLRFMPWATVVRTVATRGRGVDRLLPAAEGAIESHRRRLPTAVVNRIVAEAQAATPHPRTGGRAVRVLYAVQAAVSPPTIVLFTTGRLEEGYQRYLERALRAHEPFPGSPLRLVVRVRARHAPASRR
jgi:GTP-binding protein